MNQIIGIYGASGFGCEVIEVIHRDQKYSEARIVFIDDSKIRPDIFSNAAVYSWDEFLNQPEKNKGVIIAIADGRIREQLLARCSASGVKQMPVTASNAIIAEQAKIEEGAIFQPFVTVTANARIGRCFHANIYSYVAHDCHIGDFVTFAPNVMCNGNVHIEDHAYIGTGAILRQGQPGKPLIIGRNAVVGMGAVVTKDVPANAIVVGNPAREMTKG